MNRKLLVSGDRATFTVLSFDPEAEGSLAVLANYDAPPNASWIESEALRDGCEDFIGVSEGENAGLLYTFTIDHAKESCNITSQEVTLGAPCHFVKLRDGSAIALASYIGGSVALYPARTAAEGNLQLDGLPWEEIRPLFAYSSTGHGPNKQRQQACHMHQIVEAQNGLLYASDLGSDRVWILRRDERDLSIIGWLQCPGGTGPRHAVLNFDETMLYVLGELSHSVLAFDVSVKPGMFQKPISGFTANVISPTIQPSHQTMLDAAEISLHPIIKNVLYVSNRWARHIARLQPHLKDVPESVPSGDDVTIILLSGNGRAVERISHVQTNVDVIRGMRLSRDGRYAAVVGQEGGGVEVYRIEGTRGEDWSLVSRTNDGLGSGLQHVVWLQ